MGKINNGVDFVKIPSFALSNIPLLIRASKSRLPIILGTGVHSLGQVEEALMVIDTVDVAMLHCVSAYPASLDGLNLANMKFYDEAFPVPIGFSDHSVDPNNYHEEEVKNRIGVCNKFAKKFNWIKKKQFGGRNKRNYGFT